MFKRLLLFFALLFSENCLAANFGNLRLLDLEDFSTEYWRIEDNRDGYTHYEKHCSDGECWVGGAAANFDMTLIDYKNFGLYWDNKVVMNGTDNQVRHVGWQWEAGVSLGGNLDVYWYHFSQHVLDAKEDERFPLQNYYGFRYIWYERVKTNGYRNRR